MILDKNLLMSSAQAVTVTAASTDVIDQGVARDLGPGEGVKVLAQVHTAFASTDAATLTVALQGSTDNSTFTTYARSRDYAVAEIDVVGTRLLEIDVPRPAGEAALPRYLRMHYTVTTGDFIAGGKITAGLVCGRDDIVAYPAGVNVLN